MNNKQESLRGKTLLLSQQVVTTQQGLTIVNTRKPDIIYIHYITPPLPTEPTLPCIPIAALVRNHRLMKFPHQPWSYSSNLSLGLP